MEPELTQALNTVSRLISNQLRRQSPVRTGALKKSVSVRYVSDSNGTITFQGKYLKYGKYVDLGTGPYKTTKREAWNSKPGKGKGGIKARFWTSLEGSTTKNIKKMLQKAISDSIKLRFKRQRIK